MKIYLIVKETQKSVGIDTYWEHENIEAFSSKQDAEFELKYNYKVQSSGDCGYSIEEMELM